MNLAYGLLYLRKIILNNLYSLEDEGLEWFLKKSKNINTLSLLSCAGISNNALQPLRAQKFLQKFYLSHNYKITNNVLASVFRGQNHLTEIKIIDCLIGDEVLRSLTGCKTLKVVNFNKCLKVTDLGLRHIIDGQSGHGSKIQNFLQS